MERLRDRDEVVIVWEGLQSTRVLANICQSRLCSDYEAVRVCLHCCCSMMEDTVRNIPPFAFDIPMKNTFRIGL